MLALSTSFKQKIEMSDRYGVNIPSHTIYVNNLNEKVKKIELVNSLHAIFSQFGKILDVVASKNFRMRGQAFIVFEDVSSSTSALQSMQGFPFYDKPMRIAFAKSKSDAIAKIDGSYAERRKKRLEESTHAPKRPPPREKPQKPQVPHSQAPAYQRPISSGVSQRDLPNKILFVTNLPDGSSEDMVKALFGQFPGYREVRLVPERSDLAFVEFESEETAATVKMRLDNFQVKPDHYMRVAYAKRD